MVPIMVTGTLAPFQAGRPGPTVPLSYHSRSASVAGPTGGHSWP